MTDAESLAQYLDLSKPHKSSEEAQKAFDAFMEGVKALRAKHRIPDVFVIAQANHKSDEGVSEIQVSQHIGNARNIVYLLANSLGTWRQKEFEYQNTLRMPR